MPDANMNDQASDSNASSNIIIRVVRTRGTPQDDPPPPYTPREVLPFPQADVDRFRDRYQDLLRQRNEQIRTLRRQNDALRTEVRARDEELRALRVGRSFERDRRHGAQQQHPPPGHDPGAVHHHQPVYHGILQQQPLPPSTLPMGSYLTATTVVTLGPGPGLGLGLALARRPDVETTATVTTATETTAIGMTATAIGADRVTGTVVGEVVTRVAAEPSSLCWFSIVDWLHKLRE
ncbi:uncharacterized protein K452DRAFT_302897 [Aplosporella prunicola CBS 121167]|uniref:Uncharacterized protein n=1 Tax=Aplosporella prunicola CBS 121167 TaxID=1176127 RepID=A0A6A6AWY4_9PEZI|nr:uncharacterized protein K452DRAFT_302897 [Aplosporella prunicola CBS 121167]KAF2136250.1 hypothetical protein K452DRAFT_302897 [Aplosporella prunicola CBS 121167]